MSGVAVAAAPAAWYAGRRVLVTGHTGFKGAWLSAWLLRAGATVVGYALPPEKSGLFAAAGLGAHMASYTGDVRDNDGLARRLKEAAPEIVFHMAAQSLVRRSYDDPVGTYATNVMGTVNLLDVVRRASSVRAVVIVTSDKCYAEPSIGLGRGYREDDPMGGTDPYSSSKGCAELVTATFTRAYFTADGAAAVASVRAGNVIGGGDWAVDRIVPDLMRAAARGDPAEIRHPDAVRPWQFVLEPLRGYLLLGAGLAESGRAFEGGWNFGPREADAVPVRELVARVAAAWNRVAVTYAPASTGPHEAQTLRLDSGKARERLGWTPLLSLDQTVGMTVAWYRAAHEDPGRCGSLVHEQFCEYERLSAAAAEGTP